MSYKYEWWTPNGIIPIGKWTGIRIANKAEDAPYRGSGFTGDLPDFVNEVKKCLGYIYFSVTGRKLLDYLNACTKIISIDPATYGMGYNNQGGSPLKDVVSIVRSGSKLALYGLFNAGNYDIIKFINKFNLIPVY